MDVRPSTPKLVYVPQVSSSIEIREKAISPGVIIIPTATTVIDESAESAGSRLGVTDDHAENIKATYEDKIAKIHENYQ
jgi:hypothetical protein